MEFTIAAKDLSGALSAIAKHTKATVVTIKTIGKNSIELAASSEECTLKYTLEASDIVSGKGPVTVNSEMFKNILNSRKTISFKLEGESLKFSEKKSYKGHIVVMPPEEITIDTTSEINWLDAEQIFSEIKPLIEASSLNDAKGTGISMDYLFRIQKKGFELAIFDNFHGCYINYELGSKVGKGSITEFSIPSNVLTSILDFKGVQKLGFSASTLHMDCGSVYGVFPYYTAESTLDSFIQALVHQEKQDSLWKFSVKKEDFVNAITNAFSVVSDKSSFLIYMDNKGRLVSKIKSHFGEVATVLPCDQVEFDKDTKIYFDIHILNDIIGVFPGNTLDFTGNDSTYFLQWEHGKYLGALVKDG